MKEKRKENRKRTDKMVGGGACTYSLKHLSIFMC